MVLVKKIVLALVLALSLALSSSLNAAVFDIYGTVYEDVNVNGLYDAGEKGIENALLTIKPWLLASPMSPQRSIGTSAEWRTDALGNHNITVHDLAGTGYSIRVVEENSPVQGWISTTNYDSSSNLIAVSGGSYEQSFGFVPNTYDNCQLVSQNRYALMCDYESGGVHRPTMEKVSSSMLASIRDQLNRYGYSSLLFGFNVPFGGENSSFFLQILDTLQPYSYEIVEVRESNFGRLILKIYDEAIVKRLCELESMVIVMNYSVSSEYSFEKVRDLDAVLAAIDTGAFLVVTLDEKLDRSLKDEVAAITAKLAGSRYSIGKLSMYSNFFTITLYDRNSLKIVNDHPTVVSIFENLSIGINDPIPIPESSSSISSSSSSIASSTSTSSSSSDSSISAQSVSSASSMASEAVREHTRDLIENRSYPIDGYFIHYGEGAYDWVYVTKDSGVIARLSGIDENDNMTWELIRYNNVINMLTGATFNEERSVITFGEVLSTPGTDMTTASILANKSYAIDGYFVHFADAAYDWIYINASGEYAAKLTGLNKNNGNMTWIMLQSSDIRSFDAMQLNTDKTLIHFGIDAK